MSFGTGSLTGRNGHGVVVYFVVIFDQHPKNYGVWENGHLKPGQASVQAGGSTAAAYYGEVATACDTACCASVMHALRACIWLMTA